jgi:hypothetical protein
MQPTIYSVERLAEFQQLETEKQARELWKWRTKAQPKISFYMMMIKLIV